MKLVTFSQNGIDKTGVFSDCGIIPLRENGFDYETMNDVVCKMGKDELKKLKELEKSGNAKGILSKNDVKIEAPIPEPLQDLICLGINYMAHAKESMRYKKDAFETDKNYAVYFAKRVNRAWADGDEIPSYSDFISTLDYESELAVIIGKDAKDVKKEDAYNYVFGYTIVNDVTARELQTKHKQWYFGKSLDGFTPMGPCILTSDEVENPPVFRVKSYVNGELRQDGTTDLLIHDIPEIISELSHGFTLKAGTIISTGTPAGVGMGFQPPKFLKPGDEVVCEIDGIGKIANKIK
ncbi:MAG: fumarylacetoacetate hydrolase family protein [Clostridia bacterium]|jgi:2-keto-4-pentenoate hydratase/2-oxohepta-3-ene-1,7-dioic acid hydratase in catechol pathway|nr:fumarylacetoacetate hydrolase family protein [Clostridia bacterium]MCI1999805.1 fumarylacetoacetate hydrolase family protein [Clostridia bacterium]MCI2014279.1 fumarylacetoacetate hydrolase family protein [Clostridia bacterium]